MGSLSDFVGGGGGFVLVSSADISGAASVDFILDSSKYQSYLFVLQNLLPSQNSTKLYMRTSSDSGATFDSGSDDYTYNILDTGPSNLTEIRSTGDTQINISGEAIHTYADISANISVIGPHLLQDTRILYSCSRYDDAFNIAGGKRAQESEVNAVRFFLQYEYISSGTITMYGLANS